MSTLAKAMVLVILGLSVAFAVVSGQLFAKRERLRAEYEEVKKSKATEVTKLTNEKEALAAAKSKLQDDLSKKETDIERMKSDITNLTDMKNKLTADVTDYKAWRKGVETQLNQLRDEAKNKTERLEATEKTLNETKDQLRAAQEQARQKELEAKKAQQQAKDAAEQQKQLEIAVKDLKQQLEIVKSGGGQADETGMVQAPIDALIIKVDRSANLVVINKGRDQGVEKGYVFTVYRGDTYLGDLKIENVAATVAAGAPVAGTTIGAIREGDNASTRIR